MGIYIKKSLHSNWIKVGHHLITEKRPSVYYRFITPTKKKNETKYIKNKLLNFI